jgi:hypothetical protein
MQHVSKELPESTRVPPESGSATPETDRFAPGEPEILHRSMVLDRRERRWLLMRDLAVFQGKLLLDGLRDALLAPVALVTGIVGLISGRDKAHSLFYSVLRGGHRLERWINLFGAVEPRRLEEGAQVDDVVERVETMLRAQAAKGGVTQSTKERIDAILDAIQRKK